jgi:hypothetical protein
MGTLARILVALTVAFAMVFVGTGVALATTVMTTGLVTVSVAEGGPDGTDVFVPVPAIALDLGLGIAALAMPPEERERLRAEVAPYAPALREIADELEEMPDATLVEVVTDRESVRVEKRGRSFRIDVDSPDGQVHVTLPAATLSKVVRFLT